MKEDARGMIVVRLTCDPFRESERFGRLGFKALDRVGEGGVVDSVTLAGEAVR